MPSVETEMAMEMVKSGKTAEEAVMAVEAESIVAMETVETVVAELTVEMEIAVVDTAVEDMAMEMFTDHTDLTTLDMYTDLIGRIVHIIQVMFTDHIVLITQDMCTDLIGRIVLITQDMFTDLTDHIVHTCNPVHTVQQRWRRPYKPYSPRRDLYRSRWVRIHVNRHDGYWYDDYPYCVYRNYR